MSTSRAHRTSTTLALALALMLAACANDPPPEGPRSCSGDIDCPDGTYCGSSGESANLCTADCGGEADGAVCGASEVCVAAEGRCAPSANTTCTLSSECRTPPGGETFCKDAQTQVQPKTVGTCMSGACVYTDRDNPCDLGCNMNTGRCFLPVELCDDVTCEEPPPASCDNRDRAVTYDAIGTCMLNDDLMPVCDYNRQRTNCASGCELLDGVPSCAQSACTADACDNAPAAECDAETLVQFTEPGACMEVAGMAECTFQRTRTNCLYLGGACDAGGEQCMGAKTQSGELIVTEFMADPELSDTEYEWIEVYNTTDMPIDLNGYVLRSRGDTGVEEHTIGASTVVPANSFALLANGIDPLDDGATAPAYQYADVTLSLVDFIELVDTQGATLDYIYWENGTTMPGRSRKLDPTAPLEATSNDDLSNLCPSLADPYGVQMNQFGTPGAVNTACVADPCASFDCAADRPDPFCKDDDTLNGPTVADPVCENTRFNNPSCDFMIMDQACGMSRVCVEGACEDM